ncbi:MAG: dihydrodipicolinate synthase family protein [Anaerolineae bacterium]|nr:dihydrodipicolinate synthase family protein [Gemmatimonadaceae bacterium]
MTDQIAGILGPVVSTFDSATGDLDAILFRANVRAHMAEGLSGVVVAGSTGEAALLDERERQQLVEWARPLVPDDCWLIAGVGAESTRLCLRRAQDAAERGANAVLVIAPNYYVSAMTSDALVTHFRRVADESPVPVLLYNIPQYAHLTLDPGLVLELSSHGNITGIKDSSGDLKLLGAYLAAQSGHFTVLTGSGGGLYAGLELGARGGILGVSLFAGRLAAGLYAAWEKGDKGSAGRAQERLIPLAKIIVGSLGVPGVKAALDLVGLSGGLPRPPLLPLKSGEREQVSSLLSSAGLMPRSPAPA